MKSLDASYLAKLQATENKPVLLYEIYLDSGTLYFTDHIADIVFPSSGGHTYTALAISHDKLQIGGDNLIDTIQVHLDNVPKTIGNYCVYERFRGRAIIVRRVYADLLGSSNYAEVVFSGTMKEPLVDYYRVSVECISGQILQKKEPLYNYQRKCRWQLGGAGCGASIAGYELEENNAPDSGSTTTLVDSNLSATANIYANGVLECDFISGSTAWTEKRRIKSYDSGTRTITVEIPFSQTTANATRFKAIAGCDKKWETCHDKFANLLNFGGFIHVR